MIPTTITSVDPDEVHEWRVAIYDLIDSNRFYPARVTAKGPYALHLSIIHNHIVLDVRHPETFSPIAAHYLSLTPFRSLIRDYFRIRESYYEAIRSASTFQIEAVDMGRRGLHNQAAELSDRAAQQQAGDGSRNRPPAFHTDLRCTALCSAGDRAGKRAADDSFRVFDEFGALAHCRGAGPQTFPRTPRCPLCRRTLGQGRPLSSTR